LIKSRDFLRADEYSSSPLSAYPVYYQPDAFLS
jgi:hypothetical protein